MLDNQCGAFSSLLVECFVIIFLALLEPTKQNYSCITVYREYFSIGATSIKTSKWRLMDIVVDLLHIMCTDCS